MTQLFLEDENEASDEAIPDITETPDTDVAGTDETESAEETTEESSEEEKEE